MARVLNNPFGELRGRTQAGVFTRTRAGQILRRYSRPVDTKNPEQLANRSRLGSLAVQYCNLINKSEWETFALDASRFNPVDKLNTGNQTGISAFIGINQIQLAMMSDSTKIGSFSAAVDFNTFTPSILNLIDTPPTQTPSGIFSLSGIGFGPPGEIFEISDLSFSWTELGKKGTLNLVTSVPVTGNFDGLKDTFNNRVGLLTYMSTPVRHEEERPRVILYKTAYFKVLETATPVPLSNATAINVFADFGTPKHQANQNEWVQLTVYMVSQFGGAKKLISKMVQVI